MVHSPRASVPRRRNNRDGAEWSSADLAARIDTAARFAQQLLGGLASIARGRSHPLEAMREKIVGEAGMLLYCVAAVQRHDPRLPDVVRQLTDALAPLARSEAAVAAICSDPGRAADQAIAHAVLSRLGHTDHAFDTLLRSACRHALLRGPEELPFARLEHEWIARVWPDGFVVPSERGLLNRSMLGRPLEVLSAARLDVYAFTHCVMFATDFGARRVALPRSITAIEADADAALALTLDIDDFDVTCELLMTWPMLGRRWSPSAAFAFQLLAGAMDDVGFLQGPTFDQDRWNTLRGDDRHDYALTTSYHTTFVMGMLCAASLRAGCQPPATVDRSRPTSALERLSAFDPMTPRTRWRRALRALPEKCQGSLAPLMLTSILRSAKDTGDIHRVQALLQVALTCGLARMPVVGEAAEFLQRAVLAYHALAPSAECHASG